ncbi:MAG TPA: hypothetical protein VGU46_08010 [Acidobacteriaceae bacterium]|nr:hypothetical protein [Acidobacteriaceae bacterium]
MTASSPRSAMYALLSRAPLTSNSAVAPTTPPDLQSTFANREAAHPAIHPGDILYWTACLGGACLLLLCATR